MQYRIIRTSSILLLAALLACRQQAPAPRLNAAQLQDPEVMHASVKQLTDVIVYDIFSPPVAARIYAYACLAMYEAARFNEPQYPSLAAQMREFPPMPQPGKGKQYNFLLAGARAFEAVAQKVTFSTDSLKLFEQRLYARFKDAGLNDTAFENSIAFGNAIAAKVLERAAKDNYKESRGYPRYTVTGERGTWQPTPPDYMDAIEPYWSSIHPFILDTCNQFTPLPACPYDDKDTSSRFYREMMEVYHTGINLTKEQQAIASFWDCNPYVMHHTGHAMFATKKITPGGHWMGIAAIASRQAKAGYVQTAQAYALTAATLLDAFIACWDEKYRSRVIRPQTVINQLVDPGWEPLLQTPPFPEYTSGHSVISGAAAEVLTCLYGDSMAFADTTEVEYGAGERYFTSFRQAANEAGISRLYGGIHYRSSVDHGLQQGRSVGVFIAHRIKVATGSMVSSPPVAQNSPRQANVPRKH
ncbi:MAG TPA: vanadium-dependent haloperoxidase [Chitinophaga sp.]|uniref:vanadium-dependent haloperoxidase n=1 Tax=Chitinophaga sp. TaxID=1869181 RepID=UPI002DBFCAB7|nr:vanadium-dependent haloperoxidase [Chitinophaga sp.]HEU4554681.1 vanadium-dependent haloperoxidase [Chitinophaga sp.]